MNPELIVDHRSASNEVHLAERVLLVYIATVRPSGSNTFIDEHLSDPMIAHTQTSRVFGHHRP